MVNGAVEWKPSPGKGAVDRDDASCTRAKQEFEE